MGISGSIVSINQNNPKCACSLVGYLSSGLDALPDAEEADDPHGQQTESQVPLDGPQIVNTAGDGQHITPGRGERPTLGKALHGLSVSESERERESDTERETERERERQRERQRQRETDSVAFVRFGGRKEIGRAHV